MIDFSVSLSPTLYYVLRHAHLVSCISGIAEQNLCSLELFRAHILSLKAAGDQHSVKLQLSGLFAELRDKMEEEMVRFRETKKKNDKHCVTEKVIDLK